MTELSKKFGEEWAALSSDQKQVYTEKAVAEKKIADEKIAAYLAANPDAAKAAAADEDDDDEGGGKKAAKKKKDPNMPKKGRTSYLIFQEENRVSFVSVFRKCERGLFFIWLFFVSGASQGCKSDAEDD